MKKLILSATMLCALSGLAVANDNLTEAGKAETECYREVIDLPEDERSAAFIACMQNVGYEMVEEDQ